MRIAQIAPPWITIPPKNYGGTESVIYNLVEELVKLGHDITLFAPGDAKSSAKQVSFFPKSLLEEGVPWSAHLKACYHLYKAIAAVKEQPFDIIHTHLSVTSDLHLFPLCASLTAPHVTTLHSHFPFDHIANWSGDADRYYMDWASSLRLIAISESARRQELKRFSLNFAGVVYNGIPTDQYRPTNKPLGDFFMWFGRFSPEKGAHLAIEAARRAQVPLVLAGTIDRSNREAAQYFYDRIKSQVDDHQIRYIGPINLKQKISYLSRARGFLNPIEWEEPFGMVMIEAMALGCPVISFTRGAAPELVAHEQTGFLVNDLSEMVEAIPRLASIDRSVVREHVENKFSSRVMAHRYADLYEKVISPHEELATSG